VKHYAVPALFAFRSSLEASAPELQDEQAPELCGEAAAVRVLYQGMPAPAPRPRRGTPIRDFFAGIMETLFPRPLVPAYARVASGRRNARR